MVRFTCDVQTVLTGVTVMIVVKLKPSFIIYESKSLFSCFSR